MKLEKDANINSVWQKFKKCKNDNKKIEYRNKLIEYYSYILDKISNKMHSKIQDLPAEDLRSYGVDGLLKAIDNFDINQDIKFESYATWRIQGSIIDNIRRADWVPRLVRQNYTKMQKILANTDPAYLNEEILSKNMNISKDEAYSILVKAQPKACLSTDFYDGEKEEYSSEDFSSTKVEPINYLLKREIFSKLFKDDFSEDEIKIIYLYYYKNVPLKDIAKNMACSGSKISQKHIKILDKLRKKIENNPKYTEGLLRMIDKTKD